MKSYNFSKKWKETDKKNVQVTRYGEAGLKICPKCGGHSFVPTGKTDKGNRVYRCITETFVTENNEVRKVKCDSIVGSPTHWAYCSKVGIIGKDLFVNDCEMCNIAKKEGIDVNTQKCPYFVEKAYKDEEN